MESPNVKLVRDFCQAWSRRNVEELLRFFAEDAVYHNIPLPAVSGKPAIGVLLNQILAPAQAVEFEMLNIAEQGDVVFTERIDRFQIGDRRVELPVAGVFQVKEGKITAWRDYFDLATWTRQASA